MKNKKHKRYAPPAATAYIELLLEENIVASARMEGIETIGQEIQGEYDFEETFEYDTWFE